MLKLLDYLYLGISLPNLKKEVLDTTSYEKFKKTVLRPKSVETNNCVWICFPGWNMSAERAQKIGFIPNEGTRIIYQGPMSLIGLNPTQTKESLEKLKEDVLITLKEEKLDHLPIKIFGYSAGTLAAFWLSSYLKVTKVIAVSTGHKLGEGIFNSLITFEAKKLMHKAGWNKVSYDERVTEYNQENNILGIPNGEILLYAGKHDTYVPYKHSEIMHKKLEEAGKNPRFFSYDLLDHVSIILYLGYLNKTGKDPYLLGNENLEVDTNAKLMSA